MTVRPTVSNKRSAKATSSSPAPAPRQSTVMPLPTAHGVFGMARMTGTPGKKRSMAALGTPASIEMMSVSFETLPRIVSQTPSMTCGLTARSTMSAPDVAASLSVWTGNGCFLSKILARAAWRTVATISSGRINPRAMKASARSPPSFPSPTMVSFLFNVSMRSLYLRFAVNWRRIDEARALHAAFAEAFFETILGARETFAPVILWPSK